MLSLHSSHQVGCHIVNTARNHASQRGILYVLCVVFEEDCDGLLPAISFVFLVSQPPLFCTQASHLK